MEEEEKHHQLLRAETALLLAEMEAIIVRARAIIADRQGLTLAPGRIEAKEEK